MELTSGKIIIEGFKLHAFHGVMEQERIVGNDYIIDIEVEYPLSKATDTDNVLDTLNYADIADIIKAEMQKPSALVEHVAGRIIATMTERYPLISAIELSLKKSAPPMSHDIKNAGVRLQWKCK